LIFAEIRYKQRVLAGKSNTPHPGTSRLNATAEDISNADSRPPPRPREQSATPIPARRRIRAAPCRCCARHVEHGRPGITSSTTAALTKSKREEEPGINGMESCDECSSCAAASAPQQHRTTVNPPDGFAERVAEPFAALNTRAESRSSSPRTRAGNLLRLFKTIFSKCVWQSSQMYS